jgi:CheY-like chemotaxis protein
MEAFGQLAGGIAHDFNNLLSIIQLFTSFVRKTLAEDDERAADLDEVMQASNRAADLILQMLTFTRQKPSNAQIVSMSAHLQRVEPKLRRALGSSAQLIIEPAEKDATVRIDPTLLEQVLVSVTQNARDAMPDGGQLTLRIAHTTPSVQITFTDTGVGMKKSTLRRATEPFFTTKEAERTGLGLAMCLSIIEQANGLLEIASRPGQGSTITITLPNSRHGSVPVARSRPEPTRLSGTERILLVEDIDKLRQSLSRTLTEHGYAVVEAANGLEALEVLRHEDVDLVLTDLVMPMLSGTALAATLSETSPDLPIVLMTGYAKRYSAANHPCILKPFKLPELLSLIRGQLTPHSAATMSVH